MLELPPASSREHTLRSVGKRHHGVLPCGRRERANDHDVALEIAGKGVWVGGLPDDATVVAGEAVNAHELVRCADHAGVLVRRTDDAGGGRDIHADRWSRVAGTALDAEA